ncbi:MAG: UrcA family protein [Pseudomonadota bacterium]
MKTTTLIAASAVAVFAFAPAAQAAEADDFAFDFTFDVAKLETTDGAQQILDDMEDEVKRACKQEVTGSRISIVDEECVDDAMERAVRAINSRNLTAAFDSGQG